jgi:hypothetical protein
MLVASSALVIFTTPHLMSVISSPTCTPERSEDSV